MATSKTLTPTNVTVSIPAMTDVPDASVFSTTASATVDAVNKIKSDLTRKSTNKSITVGASTIESGDIDVTSNPGENLFVVGFDISSSTEIVPLQIYMSNKNTIHYRLRNITSAQQTCTLYVYYC